jgi:hypothetical protein
MSGLYRNQLLLMKAETTPGTLETLTGADAIPCELLTPNPQEFTEAEREMISSVVPGMPYASVMTQKRMSLPIVTEFAGSGTAGTAPAFDKLLLAFGFNKTIVSSTSVTYNLPWPLASTRYSVGFDLGGQLHAGKGGIVTTCSIKGEVGGFAKAEFNYEGAYVPVTASTAVTPVFQAFANPAPFNSSGIGSFTIASESACVRSFEVNLSNVYTFQDDGGNCGARHTITDRTVEGSVTIERQLLADLDPYALVASSTLGNLIFPYGTVSGNISTVTLPSIQLTSVAPTNVDGVLYWQLGYKQRASALNQQLTIVFT